MSDFGKAPIKREGGIADPDAFEWQCGCPDCEKKYYNWKADYDNEQAQYKEKDNDL